MEKEERVKNKKTLKRELYEYSVKKWWVLAIATALLSLWVFVLQFFGNRFGLMVNGELTDAAAKITVAVLLLWFSVTVTKLWAENKNQKQMEEKIRSLEENQNLEALENAHKILGGLLGELSELETSRAQNYRKFVFEKGSKLDLLKIIKPEERIKDTVNAIINMVSNSCNIDKSNIGVSIAVEYDGKWSWLVNRNNDDDLSLAEVVSNPKTSFSHVINKQAACVFYPDKRQGVYQNKYVAGKIDEGNANEGSIYCRNISINDKAGNVARAVLSVTTYNTRICEQDDEYTTKMFKDKIMPLFEIRLKTELCLYFIMKAAGKITSAAAHPKPVKPKPARRRSAG